MALKHGMNVDVPDWLVPLH